MEEFVDFVRKTRESVQNEVDKDADVGLNCVEEENLNESFSIVVIPPIPQRKEDNEEVDDGNREIDCKFEYRSKKSHSKSWRKRDNREKKNGIKYL